MKIGYVIGPYSAPTPGGVQRNIDTARAISGRLWELNIPNVCPHTNSAMFNYDFQAPESIYLQGYLEIMRRCDFVVLASGWQTSHGSISELLVADEMGIPVFEWGYNTEEELLAWINS